ncbi:hypothetical protein Leryth_019075 [Lithospermum erythrorhizon]|nr:hypothetical protein Leryth_019075 [Lithospermum erythrorhizon]
MNFFSKSRTTSPPHHPLHQAVSSLQTNLTDFFHNPINPFFTPTPFFAKISTPINPKNNVSTSTSNTIKNNSLSVEDIEERLTGIPVFALSNAAQEFVLVSGFNTGKSLGLFCFGENDANTLLQQMESMDPSMRNGSKVVPVALNKVFKLKVDGVAFRLIPEASQVKNAVKERKRAGIPDESFAGVPVFQSKSLLLRSQKKSYRPVFFRKEDLEKSLTRASQQQRRLNPAFREGDIEVVVFEDIIQGMKDASNSQFDDVVFIPPGLDVSTDPSQSQQ